MRKPKAAPRRAVAAPLPRRQVAIAIAVLLVLIFSKYFYMVSLTSYLHVLPDREVRPVGAERADPPVPLPGRGRRSARSLGGPVGDRIGRKPVIWFSILGVLPFALLLPHANLFWTTVLTVVIGLILSSAFSAILVYAQELMPGKVGMVSGLFFGFAFGMGGLGAAVLGELADRKSIDYVYSSARICRCSACWLRSCRTCARPRGAAPERQPAFAPSRDSIVASMASAHRQPRAVQQQRPRARRPPRRPASARAPG